jgi:hypothetical protein
MSRFFFADAHRGDAKRFVVRADEKLSAFLELERAIRAGESKQQHARAESGSKLQIGKRAATG